MRYGSVCSGIEACTVAWHGMAWEPQWFSEIEKFPNAVLQHHYPNVLNLGDMTKLHERKEFNERPIDLLVGGTPCQSFSVAGLRKGLDDPRGNLALHFLKLVETKQPRWVVWENVPGVLSSRTTDDRGIEHYDFDSFTAGLGQLGYGVAWRILDAQYFGVPQRRRRVFVVGYLGDWRPATAVLFERQSLSGDNPPSRKTRQEVTGSTGNGTSNSCEQSNNGKSDSGKKSKRTTYQPEVSPAIKARDAKGVSSDGDGDGDGAPLIVLDDQGGSQMTVDQSGSVGTMRENQHQHQHQPIVFQQRSADGHARVSADGNVPTLDRMAGGQREPCVVLPALVSNGDAHSGFRDEKGLVAFKAGQGAGAGSLGLSENVTPTLGSGNVLNGIPSLQSGMMVRRLTPRECERLQGFPDDYTLIPYGKKPASDGPRYKALGNSMAVPVMKWIGKRIELVEEILKSKAVKF